MHVHIALKIILCDEIRQLVFRGGLYFAAVFTQLWWNKFQAQRLVISSSVFPATRCYLPCAPGRIHSACSPA